MASTLMFLLQLLLVSLVSASQYFGGTTTYTYKGRNPDGSFKVQIRDRDTYDGCYDSLYWYCSGGDCGYASTSQRGTLDSSTNAPPYNGPWCEAETVTTRVVTSNRPFEMRSTSCCWIPTRTYYWYQSLYLNTVVDLGERSDTGEPNRSPEIAILPFLRVPENCPRTYKLMSFDPDGDKVRCRYGNSGSGECYGCTQPSGFNLDQDSCTLNYQYSNANSLVNAFELVVEDFPQRHISLSYSDGSQSSRSPLSARRKRAATTYPTTTATQTATTAAQTTTTFIPTTSTAPTTTTAAQTTTTFIPTTSTAPTTTTAAQTMTTAAPATTTATPTTTSWWWWTTTATPTTTSWWWWTTTATPTTTSWWWWTTTTAPTTTSWWWWTTTTAAPTTTTTAPTTTSWWWWTTTTAAPTTTTTAAPTTTTTAPTTTSWWWWTTTTAAPTTTTTAPTTTSWWWWTTTTAAPTTTTAAPTTTSWWWWTTTTAAPTTTTTAAPTTTTTAPTTTSWWWWTTTTAPTTTSWWWWTTTTAAPTTTTTAPTTTSWWWWTTTTAAPTTTTTAAPTTTTTAPTTTSWWWWTTTTAPTTTSWWWWTTTTAAPTTTTTAPTTTSWWWWTTTTAPTTTSWWWWTTTTAAPTTTTTAAPTTTTTVPTTTWWWWWTTTTAAPTTTTTAAPTTTTTVPTTTWWWTTGSHLQATSPPLSKLPLQFSLLVDPPAPSCQEGLYLPQFVHPTPEHGARIQAEVNKEVEIRIKAQASYAAIQNIIISGPMNMTKHKTTKNEYVLRWTPLSSDLGDYFPVCFAAESATGSAVTSFPDYTTSNYYATPTSQSGVYQSEMRCVILKVGREEIKTNVICTESKMRVEVEKSSLHGLSEDHLHLSEPSNTLCSLERYSNSTHIIGIVPLNACGTQIEEDEVNLIFKNVITTVDDSSALITRKDNLEVGFYCQYPKKGNVSLGFTAHRKNVEVFDKGFGTFTYQFEFYPSHRFRTIIDPSLYPLEYDVGEKIYMEIDASSIVNDTEMFVESCRASPYDNPNYQPTYSIIEDGCPVDPTVMIHNTDNQRQFRFSIEAFKFIGLHDQVYISCSVMMCEAGIPNSRCSQGCISNDHHRRKRDAAIQTATHFVSQGPLRLKRSADVSMSAGNNLNLNLNLIFIAGCLLAAFAMICGLVLYRAKMSKVKYQRLASSES